MTELRYGDDRTIHRTDHVNVELDSHGTVVAVWFRCLLMPFTASVADPARAAEMRAAYRHHPLPGIKAIVIEHEPGPV
jgi:hypothetical protein